MIGSISDKMPFAKMMGVTITEADKGCVRGTLLIRPDLCTTGHILHGGAIMAFADALGAIGAALNLPEAAKTTTTIESKTNFLSSAKENESVRGEATPLQIGRRVSVWQTKIANETGKLIAVVTQTQLVI